MFRERLDEVKSRLSKRNFHDLSMIDKIIELDEKRKSLQFAFEDTQAKVNSTSKEIGNLITKGQNDLAMDKRKEVTGHKILLPVLVEQLADIENQLHNALILIPNLPHNSVPSGSTSQDNEVIRQGGEIPELPGNSEAHWDLAKRYDLINFDLGNKITGSGFPVYKKHGAKLQRALIQYFLDFNTAEGYVEYAPPLLVNEASAYGTGQLPDKEGQMYFVPEDGLYLIPTAEVPVTNIYRDEILKESELPIKMTAFTPCFRREAGSHGKDVRGLNRIHQFDKVEIIQLTTPEKSYTVLEEMLLHVEKLLQSLALPYRILRLCGGDMGFTSALTYDLEVYSAGQQKWLEVSSVSNFESFQSNRMKIRYKDSSGKMQLVHTLNGSSLALPRIMAALLENNQHSGGIKIPAVLHAYFGSDEIT